MRPRELQVLVTGYPSANAARKNNRVTGSFYFPDRGFLYAPFTVKCLRMVPAGKKVPNDTFCAQTGILCAFTTLYAEHNQKNTDRRQ